MKKPTNNPKSDEFDDELRPEYDLSQLKGGVRGKYAERCKAGTNVVFAISGFRAKTISINEAITKILNGLFPLILTFFKLR